MRVRLILTLAAAAAALSACAYYGARYGGYDYAGRDYAAPRDDGLLDPWLAETDEGRTIVATGFGAAAEGRLDQDTAERANIWFRRYADTDRDLRLTDEEIRVALVQAARDNSYF